jgi:tetratricopeptide (TPR) repeat protein
VLLPNKLLRRAIALTLVLASPLAAASRPDTAATLSAAKAKIDADDAAGALALLDPLVKREPKNARAYHLRATARLMLGTAGGNEDLDKAIALDPTLRQAWLDRGAVAMADKRYAAALSDFQKARDLDPADPDGSLDVGAAQLLLGKLDDATHSFEAYLGQAPTDGAAHFLVAKNYALAGYAGLAVQSLQQAIALDERLRASARSDPAFADVASNPRFQDLMTVDTYKPAPGTLHAERSYGSAYDNGNGPLLLATMDALQTLGEAVDRRVEVTPGWALLWGAMRIKLYDDAKGQGQVAVSAREAMTPAEWEQRTKKLFDTILIQLAKRKTLSPAPKAATTPGR